MLMDLDCSFEIDNVCNVDEGLKKIAAKQYDIVVSDFEMPQKNGLEFLEELYKQNDHIPFILFTGKGREEVAIQALNLGVDAYLNKQGSPETVYGELYHAIRLLNDRNKAKNALVESEKRYRTIMEQAADSIIVHDKNRRIIDVNEATIRKLGYTRKELLSMTITDISPNATEIKIEEMWSKILAGQTITMEDTLKAKNGNIIPIEVTLGPLIFDKEIQVIGLVRDITERKKAEEDFRMNELILQTSSDSIVATDLQGKIISWNKGACDIFGYSAKEILGENISKIVKPVEKVRVESTRFSTEREQKVDSGEWECTRKDGSPIWVLLTTTLLKNSQNEPVGIVGIGKDISERKKAEEALQNNEEGLLSLIDSMDDLVFVLDSKGVFKRYHQTKREGQLYVSAEKFIGKHFREVLPKDLVDLYQAAISRIEASDESQEIIYSMEMQGEILWYSARLSPLRERSGHISSVTVVVRNITDIKKAEVALRQERAMLESVTKNIGAGLVMISKDYKILWMNDYLRQFTGASENNHCYSSFNTCTSICPDCGPKKIFEGAQFDSREYCNQTEFNQDHPVWFELIATPIKDADGNVVAALELTVNITEKKEAEKKLKEASVRIGLMVEKLRVMSGLTRHDVRNKLSAVTGYAYLLKKKHADLADVVDGLGKMEQSVGEVMRIFDFAKLYEQLGVEELSYVDVAKAVDEVTALFPDLNLNVVNGCHGLSVLADSFLRQVFYNFIDNTIKYGQKTTAIRVYYEKTEQGELGLIYEDDGVGISTENKSKLFSEGFSTGGSTGFGLFLIKKMIDVYGWQIHETGEPGKGVKFVITIPSSSVSV